MIFGKKKKKTAEAIMKAEEAKRVELQKALKASEIQIPLKREFYPYPREYMKFLEEVKIRPKTWYEKICQFSEGLFPIEPGGKTREKILTELRAAYINATPKGVFSFAILSTLLLIVFSMFYVVFIGLDIFGGFFFGVALINFWYFYTYPASKAKSMSVQMSADTVLAILYMVIYMRSSPNLEGAIKFSSQNLEGPLAWDLRKLLWDIETGKYSTADEALVDYITKWKDKNKEFSEALNLLRGSVAIEAGRREMVYDETINVILDGTRERAKHYAAGLRMPMTLIYAMGVLLPVMGLVLFPIILIFISEQVKPSFIFFGYDILLPLSLYFIVSHILSSKPPTFSPPDISKAKGIPPMGKFSFKGASIPIWPIALLVSLPFILMGITGLSNPDDYFSVSFSLLATFGFSLIIVAYAFLDSYQKIKIRIETEKIENEFATALFQLGNIIAGGAPLESAIDKVKVNLKELKIVDMFNIVSLNMKKFGYTFEEALFDKEVGAIWFYPSKLIHSIMQTIIQSSKKSIKTAASSMVVISRYLKGVHDVKEEIEDILGETTSSMRFLAMFLSPLVAGITVTLAVIILKILSSLGATMQELMTVGGGLNTAQSFFLVPWAMGGELPILPATFQMIVGIYMIETAVLLAAFLNGVKYGEDPVGLRNSIWNILLTAIILYIISWFVTYSMFGGTIESLLAPVSG
jgi:hypothetical protein